MASSVGDDVESIFSEEDLPPRKGAKNPRADRKLRRKASGTAQTFNFPTDHPFFSPLNNENYLPKGARAELKQLQAHVLATKERLDHAKADHKQLTETLEDVKRRVAVLSRHKRRKINADSSVQDVLQWLNTKDYVDSLDLGILQPIDGDFLSRVYNDKSNAQSLTQDREVLTKFTLDVEILFMPLPDLPVDEESSPRGRSKSPTTTPKKKRTKSKKKKKTQTVTKSTSKRSVVSSVTEDSILSARSNSSFVKRTRKKKFKPPPVNNKKDELVELMQSTGWFSLESAVKPRLYWVPLPHELFYLKVTKVAESDVEEHNATFRAAEAVFPSYSHLAVSLESLLYPGAYLIHEGVNSRLRLEEAGTEAGRQWKRSACWKPRSALNGKANYVSFESSDKPHHWVVSDRTSFTLQLRKNDGTKYFSKEASFRLTDPLGDVE